MPLTRVQKGKIVSDLKEKFAKADALIFADFTGLTVAKTRDFRQKLKKIGATLKVAKRTLIRLALGSRAAENVVGSKGKGPVSLILSGGETVETAQVAYNFSKTESLKILGGILAGRFLSGKEVVEIAKLPKREQLLAALLAAIQAPLTGLAGVLNANLRNLVCVLDAIKSKK